VLIELIDDDELAGHAIAALRQCTYRRRVPQPDRVRPKLEALLTRGTLSVIGNGSGPLRQAPGAERAKGDRPLGSRLQLTKTAALRRDTATRGPRGSIEHGFLWFQVDPKIARPRLVQSSRPNCSTSGAVR
jgi:hypothetical protein